MSKSIRESSTPSLAHRRSAFAVIDPAYDAEKLFPAPDLDSDRKAPWLYGQGELECYRLILMRSRKEDVKLKVRQLGQYHTPYHQAQFRLDLSRISSPDDSVSIRSNGDLTVYQDGDEIYKGWASDHAHAFSLDTRREADSILTIHSTCAEGEPPALLVAEGSYATDQSCWQWSHGGEEWSKPKAFGQTRTGTLPHSVELQEMLLKPEGEADGLIDFGREILGRVRFSCPGTPSLFVGESATEAMNDDAGDFEQSTELIKVGEDRWESRHPLALRYLRVPGDEAKDFECRAQFHPTAYRGAFACSDELLTRIWMHSAYTLRLCMHDSLIDGIKRDRVPWAGDLALGQMANAYGFGDGEIERRSLVSLGAAGIEEDDINGFLDYTLWWVISQELHLVYYDDREHLARSWKRILSILKCLQERCDEAGFLVTTPTTRLLIDRGEFEKETSLQILWWWVLRCGASMAGRAGHEKQAKDFEARAGKLGEKLKSRGWDEKKGSWRGSFVRSSPLSRHADIFAVLSGLTGSKEGSRLAGVLMGTDTPPAGTPYVKALELLALYQLGSRQEVLARVRTYWGDMLALGATTFWETFDQNVTDGPTLSYYGRPYANSLCHMWSTGPAFLLPMCLTGIRPLSDGWKRFTVSPDLCGLDWACATVPTRHGEIEVELDRDEVCVRVPAGAILETGAMTVEGPSVYQWKYEAFKS